MLTKLATSSIRVTFKLKSYLKGNPRDSLSESLIPFNDFLFKIKVNIYLKDENKGNVDH